MTSDSSSNNERPATPTNKPQRNPIERAIVWGMIGCLLLLLLYEGKQKFAYDRSLAALHEMLKDEAHERSKLSEVLASFSGSPQATPLEKQGALSRTTEYKWHSFFKDYRIHLLIEKGGDDPEILSYSTPNAPEEDLASGTPTGDAPKAPSVPAAPGMMGGAPAGAGAPPAAPGAGGNAAPNAGGGPGAGEGQRGGRGLIGMALREAVSQELALSEEQSTQLKELQEKSRDAFTKIRSMPEGERASAMQAMREQTESDVKAVLKEDQFQRLLRLSWREAGLASLERADVAALVQITDEQRAKIAEIQAARREALRALGMPAPESVTATVNKEHDEKLNAILTEDQRQSFQKLIEDKKDGKDESK